MKITLKLIPTVFLAVLCFCSTSFATKINYIATDLSDTTTGEDLWQYEYTVSDNTFNTNEGFTIWFDYNLYGDLETNPVAPNGDWDILTWNPNQSLNDDGAYDALAFNDVATLSDSFTISFIWLGLGTPGSQQFEVYNNDPFGTIEIGTTASTVPEPGTIILFGLGILGIAGGNRMKQLATDQE